MAKIVIIGAGLTGISTAYHLEQQGFSDYLLFEKDESVGGLCRSIQQDGFTFDYTGHLLHINDTYFKSLITECVGIEQFNSINRRSFIYSHNTYTKYPFQINLFGLPKDVIVECIEGFVNRPTAENEPNNFPNWVLKHFGAGIAKHFFLGYQKKIFAYDLQKITASWTGRFVPQTSLKQMLLGALSDNVDEVGYNSHFYYPKEKGIFYWVEKLAQQIKKPIKTQHCVKEIDIKNKTILFTNGHIETYDKLINTMPLDTLLGLLKEPSNSTLRQARTKLLCNSVVNFNLGINRPNLSEKHWIYFPENKFPFYRIGFGHNFADSMAPKNCSSLYGEFAYLHESEKTIQNKLIDSLAATKKLFGLSDTEIVTQKILDISHAYVIFDAWREQNLPQLLTSLENASVLSVGRYGAWKYSSMQEGVLDGKETAEKVLIKKEKKCSYPMQNHVS